MPALCLVFKFPIFMCRTTHLCVCLYICRTHESEEVRGGIGSPRTGVMGHCESPCGCWELNVDPLQKPQMSRIIKPSLRPYYFGLLLFVLFCLGSHHIATTSLTSYCVDQAGLQLARDLPAFASRVLGLKLCTSTPGLFKNLFVIVHSHPTCVV